MALTVGFAIIGAIILSLTYVPVASSLFISRKTKSRRNISDVIMDFLQKIFTPVINLALRAKIAVVVISLLLLISSLFVYSRLGGEFIPNLEEGDLASSVITLQGGSLSNTIETVKKANKILMTKFPEVKHAVCKIGSAEIPTDPTPMETGDYIIVMKDKSEWTSASSREEMMDKMQEELSVLPGVVFELQQPIQMRFNELMTGSKQDVAVKIFGDNLDLLAEKGRQTEKLIRDIPGVVDINVEKVTGSGQIQVIYNRDKIAFYGLNIADINRMLKTAFAGSSAGVVYNEEKRFDLVVRFDKQFRQDIDYVRNLYIPLASGKQVPLYEVADVSYRTGVAQVSREDTKRRITVGFNVRNRDVASVVDEVRTKLDAKLNLPAGYYTTYGGQFENLIAARERLMVAVPVALLLIFVLLFITFKSVKQALLIYTAVPFSAIGGIFALYFRGLPFSISAGVGFIALFGVAVLNGIVLIAEFNRLEKEEGIEDIYERVRRGIKIRLRPVFITALVASLGFLPMALSISAGAEVQRPLATVVIGGLISSTFLTLIVLPVLYILFSRKRKKGAVAGTIPAAVILMLVLFFALSIPSQAQQQLPAKYTMEQAVSKALESNGGLQSSVLKTRQMKALQGAAWDIGKTNVDLTYGQSNSFERDNNYSVTQEIEFPAVYASQHRLAKAETRSAEMELAVARGELIRDVKIAWCEIVFLHAQSALLDFQDSIYSWFLQAAELKAASGESPPLEKTVAETRLMKTRTAKVQAAVELQNAQRNLAYLLNEPLAVDATDSILSALVLPAIADTSSKDSPLLNYAQQQLMIRQAERGLERSKLCPGISAGYFNMSNKDLDANGRFTGFQVGLSIPVFFGAQATRIKAAGLGIAVERAQYDYYSQRVQTEVSIQRNECLNYRSTLDYYESYALKQASLLLEQASTSFSSGDISYSDYLRNASDALDIQAAYLEMLNAYNAAVIKYQFLTGIEK